MSQLTAKSMIENGIRGRIINISSQVGVVGGPLRAPYSGAKGAVCLLTKSLAAEWAPHGITVNSGRTNRYPHTSFRRGTEKPRISEDGKRKCSDGTDRRTGRNRSSGHLPRKRYSRHGHRTHTSCRWRMDRGLTAWISNMQF